MAVSRSASPPVDPAALPRLRRRTVWVLFAAVATGSTGYFAAVTVGTLLAAELGGGPAVSGLPIGAMVLGTAAATSALSMLMLRAGRRVGLLAGFGIGAAGALLAVGAALVGSLPLLVVGSALGGFGNGAAQLSRYVAADLFPADRRASAIGTVVWGATVGAVLGPNLVEPAGRIALSAGLPAFSGGYIATAGFVTLAFAIAWAALRPEPYALADASALPAPSGASEPRAIGARPSAAAWLLRPTVMVAVAALVAGQVVMVLIMTMTPIHMSDHGHGLAAVGLVISAHMAGMFALSPISGRLSDRYGPPAMIGASFAVLAAAALVAAVAPGEGGPILTVALFLLGFGWNLGFVAGSALLTRGLALDERTAVQALGEGVVWTSAAAASFASGFVLALTGYTVLSLLALSLLAPAVLLLATRYRAVRTSPA